MTRQYWTGHKRHEGIDTENRVIALLLRRSFEQPGLPVELYEPHLKWKLWLANNPLRKPRDK